MSAYIIASHDITDAEGYSPYVPGVLPLLEKHGAEILVADYEPAVLEGEKRGVVVVLRFDTPEAARAWYDDPDYAPVRKIRLDNSTHGSVHLAKPFAPPA